MEDRLLKITCGVFYVFVIEEFIRNRSSIGCSTPIIDWIMSEYIIVSFVVFITFSNDIHPAWLNNSLYILTMVCIIFLFFWNFIGTYWLISNYADGNKCLGFIYFVLVLFYQLFIYAVFFNLIYIVFRELYNELQMLKRQKEVYIELLEIYNEGTNTSEHNLNQWLLDNKVILERIDLIDTEKYIIKTKFTKIAETSYSEDCSICMQEMKEGDSIINICGSHNFHEDCVVDWFKVKPQCPLCKVFLRPILLKHIAINNQNTLIHSNPQTNLHSCDELA